MESFKDKVDRSWGDGLGRFADGRLRMLMQVSGGSQKRPGKDSLSHEELRKCACQPWLNQELTDDVLDGFFEESAEFCTQALLDPRITLACGKSDDNLVASIRKTFIALWRCKRSLGMDWQSCILGRLLGALQELAESLIKAARERGIGATEGGSVLQNGANCGTGTGARLDLSSSAAGAGAESARAAGAEADGAAGAEAAGAAEGIRPVASGTSQPYQPEQPTPTESDPSPSRPSDFTASSSSADPANALLKSKDGQARQFAILHRAARTYMDFARKIYDTSKSDGCKTCSNQGVNVICSFRALVYACKLLADMASSPQPVHSNESNATQEVFEEETLCMSVSTGIANVAALSLATDYPTLASIPHSVINGYKNVLGLSLATGFSLSQKMERKYDLLFVELTQSAFNQEQEELRIERAREASSFFRDVKVEWTNAKGDDPVTLCNRVLERGRNEGVAFPAMKQLCVGYRLYALGEDFKASDPQFDRLFRVTFDSLGRASWELFSRNAGCEDVTTISHEAMKVLALCIEKGDNWVSSALLRNLSLHCRLMAEAFAKAAWTRYCYQSPSSCTNARGHEKGLSDQANDLQDIPETRLLGCLLKAAHHLGCDGGLHINKGRNLGNCTIFCCRAIVYAGMLFASLMDPQDVQDASQEGSKGQYQNFIQGLEAQAERSNALAYFNDEFKGKFKTLETLHRNARLGREDYLQTFSHTVDNLIVPSLRRHPGTELSENRIISEMKDVYRVFESYAAARDSSTWLYRILTGIEQDHYRKMLNKLKKVNHSLEDMHKKMSWLEGSCLEEFQRQVDDKEKEYMEHMAKIEAATNALLGENSHLQGLKDKLSVSECDFSLEDEELNQAFAYAQARLDEEPGWKHRYVEHPDMKVLWYRVEELRRVWEAELSEFMDNFPARLVVKRAQKQELRDLMEQHKSALKRDLLSKSSCKDSGSKVTIDGINEVFLWCEPPARKSLREAIVDAAQSAAGVRTPEQPSESLPYIARERVSIRAASEVAASQGLLGRDSEIKKVVHVLTQKSGQRHLFIQGPPGIGKSALCNGARLELQRHSQGCLRAGWQRMNFFGVCKAEDVYATLFAGLGVIEDGSAGTSAAKIARKLAKDIFQAGCTGQAAQMLLILDTCENPLADTDAANALAAFLGHVNTFVPEVALLLAARSDPNSDPFQHPALQTVHDSFDELNLEGLQLEYAVKILRDGFGHPGYDDEAKALALQCEKKPLLLRLAAGILHDGLAGFKAIQSDLAEASNCVGSALLKWHDPEHREALLKLSPFPSFSTKQAAFMLNDDDALNTLEELYGRHLILALPAATDGQLWGLHSSVRDAIKRLEQASSARLSLEQQQQQQQQQQQRSASIPIRFAQSMTAELAKAAAAPPHKAVSIAQAQQTNMRAALEPAGKQPDICAAVSRELLREWPVFRGGRWVESVGLVAGLLLPSLKQLCDAAARMVVAEGGSHGGGVQGAFELGGKAAVGSGMGRFEEKSWAWVAKSVCLHKSEDRDEPQMVLLGASSEQLHKLRPMLQCDMLFLRASIYSSQGLYAEAVAMIRQELELQQAMLGPESPRTLSSMANLACNLGSQGNYAAAAQMHQQVVDIKCKVLGARHPETQASKQNLACSLLDQGKYVAAAEMQQEMLGFALFSNDHLLIFDSMNNLAVSLAKLGRNAEAAQMRQEVLEMSRGHLGDQHPRTLTSMNNLASSLANLGKYADAAAMGQKELELGAPVLGTDHPDTLGCMGNLAGYLGDLGRYSEAAQLQQQAFELQQKVLGAVHPDTLACKLNLARCLAALGRHSDAAQMEQEVLDLQCKILGATHPDTLHTMMGLAGSLSELGKHVEAAQMQQRMLEFARETLGTEHPITLWGMGTLAVILLDQGMHAEAAQRDLEHVVAVRSKVLGAEHPDTLRSMDSLAYSLGQQGRHVEAAKKHNTAMQLLQEKLGAEHPCTLRAMNNLGSSLIRQGKYLVATRLLRRLIELAWKALGAKHPISMASMNRLALSLSHQGEHAEAAQVQQQVLVLRQQEMGAAHPDTLRTMHNLAASLTGQGKYVAGAQMEQQVLELLPRRVPGVERDEALVFMEQAHSLAIDLALQQEYAAAAKLAQRVLLLRCEVLGVAHPDTASTGEVLHKLLSNWSKTAKKLSEANIPEFFSCAMVAVERGAPGACSASLPQRMPRWCQLLAASGNKEQAHALAVRAHKLCYSKQGSKSKSTKSCQKLCEKYL